MTSPSDSSNDGAPHNGPTSNSASVACCSTSVQTELESGVSMPPTAPVIPPGLTLQQIPGSPSIAPLNLVDSLNRRIADLEVENEFNRKSLQEAAEASVRSRQIIKDLLIEKVSLFAFSLCVCVFIHSIAQRFLTEMLSVLFRVSLSAKPLDKKL